GTITAELIAAVMLFQGLFGIRTTQIATQVTTIVEPRTGASGHGTPFSNSERAHPPATTKTKPRSSNSCALTSWARWSAASDAPAKTKNKALTQKSGFFCAV